MREGLRQVSAQLSLRGVELLGEQARRAARSAVALEPARRLEPAPLLLERERHPEPAEDERSLARCSAIWSGEFQLDAFGEVLLLLAAAARHGRLDSEGWRAAQRAAAAILERRREPDAGIWELDPPSNWTHSRLICAAGLRAISAAISSGRDSARWLAAADAIVAQSSRPALHPSGRWQRAPDDRRVDASLLLAGLRGAVPADDPRSVETCAAVERELAADFYCYRYRPGERPLGEAAA